MPRENGQISRSTTVGAAQGDGSHPRPVLSGGPKTANIHASSGVIGGIPAQGGLGVGHVSVTL